MAKDKAAKPEGGMMGALKKKGFEISIDTDTIRTAKDVAKKVFGRKKKKNRAMSGTRE